MLDLGLDGCEVRLCGLCAFVRPRVPCVPCVSRLPPVSFYRYRYVVSPSKSARESAPPSRRRHLGRARGALTPLGRLRRSVLHEPWRARVYGETSPPCAPPSVGTTLHDSAGLWIPWARARPPSARSARSAQPPPAHAAHAAHAAHSLAAAAAPTCPSPFIPPLGWSGLWHHPSHLCLLSRRVGTVCSLWCW